VETGRAFRAFAAQGSIDIPPKGLAVMRSLLDGVAVSEDDTAKTILATLNETGELVDPHTAVGLAGAARAPSARGDAPVVVLSTAHPAKFPETVEQVTGGAPPSPRSAHLLTGRLERFDSIPADAEAAKAYIRQFART